MALRARLAFEKFIVSGSLGLAIVDVDVAFTTTVTPNALMQNDKTTGVVAGKAVDCALGNYLRLRREVRHFEGLGACNPKTPYPGLFPVSLSATTRTYDWHGVTLSLIRNF